MATPSEFYSYLSDIRKGFSDYSSASSKTLDGSQTQLQQIKLVHLNLLEACSHVMEAFDPTVTVHMFTADEMRDFLVLINDILDAHHNVDFEQYYV
jgi:hypothetical protein